MARRSFSTSRRAISASASARSISPWFRLKTGNGTETLVPTWLARSPDTWNSLCVYWTPSVGVGQRPARATLEGGRALELGALGRGGLRGAAARREARAALARKQAPLLEPDRGHDRVTHADATRVRLPGGEVAGPRRERRVRQEAGRDH